MQHERRNHDLQYSALLYHDGPGIRTVVFLKGCSLGCRWCQNPESRSRSRDVLFDARLCLDGCDLCQQAAPGCIERALNGLVIHREKLDDATLNALTDCCPTQALTVCGEEQQVEEIMATVLRDKPFYDRSGGGITLSGGEPFMNLSWRTPCLKPATNRGSTPPSKPAFTCRGTISSHHYPTSICSSPT